MQELKSICTTCINEDTYECSKCEPSRSMFRKKSGTGSEIQTIKELKIHLKNQPKNELIRLIYSFITMNIQFRHDIKLLQGKIDVYEGEK